MDLQMAMEAGTQGTSRGLSNNLLPDKEFPIPFQDFLVHLSPFLSVPLPTSLHNPSLPSSPPQAGTGNLPADK